MRSLLAVLLLASVSSSAHGAMVTLSSSGTNVLEMLFTVPAQPAAHNALSIGVLTSSGPAAPAFAGTAQLYDGATLLSESLTSSVGQRYATIGSFFSATDPIIPYASIASGSIVGLFRLVVTSGSRTFDTNDLFVRPFGDAGSQPGFAGVITNVTVSTVPLPAALPLLLTALVGMFGALRRSSPRV